MMIERTNMTFSYLGSNKLGIKVFSLNLQG